MRSILFLLLLSSCGVYIGDEFRSYYKEIDREIKDRGLKHDVYSIGISLAEFDLEFDKVMALCFLNSRRIEVDRNWWGSARLGSRELIIWHEIGHCLFRLGHSNKGGIMDVLRDEGFDEVFLANKEVYFKMFWSEVKEQMELEDKD